MGLLLIHKFPCRRSLPLSSDLLLLLHVGVPLACFEALTFRPRGGGGEN